MQAAKKSNAVPNYRIIKEGSKAGKDLLRDRFGYTYTQKKVMKIINLKHVTRLVSLISLEMGKNVSLTIFNWEFKQEYNEHYYFWYC